MNGLKKVVFLLEFGGWGLEESSLSSRIQGNGGWKKVRFLLKSWGLEESTLSSKVLGNGRKYAFFESFGVWGFGRKYAFF